MQAQVMTYPKGLGRVAGALDWCGALGALFNRAVAGMLAWAEDLITEVNGPALIMCGIVAVVALMSGGALFANWPWLLQAWPAAQAVGVDIMILVAVRYAVTLLMRSFAEAHHGGGFWPALVYAVLGAFWGGVVAMLATVVYTANRVFAYQLMTGANEDAALAHFDITPDAFITQRASVLVGLIVLSAIVLALKQQQQQQQGQAGELVEPLAQHATLPESAASAPAHEHANVRTRAASRSSERVVEALPGVGERPAYVARRTDEQLVELGAVWETLARDYCADKPSIGGKALATYIASVVGAGNAPSKSKAQELAVRFRPAVLRLTAPRPALAYSGA